MAARQVGHDAGLLASAVDTRIVMQYAQKEACQAGQTTLWFRWLETAELNTNIFTVLRIHESGV